MKKLKKGDEVIVITGKDKGKRGAILRMMPSGEHVLVEGVNLVKKHTKGDPNTGERGGVVDKTMPIHSSNVMLYDSSKQKGGRAGVKLLDDGKKVRYFKSSNDVIDA